jgi:hypothetical protein
MKHLILLLLFISATNSYAQLNLVPNPSFEDTVECPQFLGQIDAAEGWSTYRNSPDYYNGCNNSNAITVPNANFGFQLAQSGYAMIGLDTYAKKNSTVGNNYREYAGAELLFPLQIGVKYYFSLYAVLAERYTGFASNNLGLRFFTNSYSLSNPAPLDNFSHMKFDYLLTDSINWNKISGSFVADSNYQYVCIGNFYEYMNTDTLIVTPFATIAYYFVDDICVTTDSLYNETWTGLPDIEQNQISIWPNPIQNYFQFNSYQQIDEIKIYDSIGKLIKSEKVESQEGRINMEILSEGIYFASFRKEKTISVYKLLKL